MTAASTLLCSSSSSRIAASNIHGTGAQSWLPSVRSGCSRSSGTALGPYCWNNLLASCVVSPDKAEEAVPSEPIGIFPNYHAGAALLWDPRQNASNPLDRPQCSHAVLATKDFATPKCGKSTSSAPA